MPGLPLDEQFQRAVACLDAGDADGLEALVGTDPRLVHERLFAPGPWLRAQVGEALDGYFQAPYLLWFVAQNPARPAPLAPNIVTLTALLIAAARRQSVVDLPIQLDGALALVVTGRVPREAGIQIPLLDVLLDAGATPGSGHGALSAGNLEGARHLIARGGQRTLATSLCLGLDDVGRFAVGASVADRQVALAAAALNGLAPALRLVIALGVDLDAWSAGMHPHATPLHHAVSSGSLEAVQVLVRAGARRDIRDRIYDGTALDWAEHLGRDDIAACLRAG